MLVPQAAPGGSASAPPTEMDQGYQQLAVRVTPWKDVGGVIVIEDD